MLTEQQLKHFKALLTEHRQQLEHWLTGNSDSADTVILDQSKVGRLSRLDAMQQQAMAQAGRNQHQQLLHQVNRALLAIEEGNYGFCESCGQDIPQNRLEARPESIYCVGCKSKLEEG